VSNGLSHRCTQSITNTVAAGATAVYTWTTVTTNSVLETDEVFGVGSSHLLPPLAETLTGFHRQYPTSCSVRPETR